MTDINPGDVVRVSTSPGFRNAAGTLVDPTVVTLKWRVFSDGELETWVYGTDPEVVKDSTGMYHADIPVESAGTHFFRWEGTGPIVAAEENTFRSVTKF